MAKKQLKVRHVCLAAWKFNQVEELQQKIVKMPSDEATGSLKWIDLILKQKDDTVSNHEGNTS